jgi:hypothetical protein
MKHSDEFIERFKVSISVSKDKTTLEKEYYLGLAKYLNKGDFKSFKDLIDKSVDFDIFIIVDNIPQRFESISKLLLKCTERIVNGYEVSALGDQIDIIRICNEYGLLEKDLSMEEVDVVNLIKKDKHFLSNLTDLFGRVTDGLICYVYLEFPRILNNYLKEVPNEYFASRDSFMYNVKNHFFNHYSIYNLSVRYLSSTEDFIKKFKEKYSSRNSKEEKFIYIEIPYPILIYDLERTSIEYAQKTHFVSPENILENLNQIRERKFYKFYSISMVLIGGLGPQGFGFTYSTPKGEIIEICSDQKETEAIIIKFKEFLKRKFLGRLEKELSSFNINKKVIDTIINYLSENLNPSKKINYHNKNQILDKVKNFLGEIDIFPQDKIINKISKAISLILRDIKLKDQFITRMDLVKEGKIKSEDIAKLTSLKGKSHYDVLRERFFWQYVVDQMYEFYIKENY